MSFLKFSERCKFENSSIFHSVMIIYLTVF